MAILYKITVSKAAGIHFFPPSLEDSAYYDTFNAVLDNYQYSDMDNITLMLFNNLTELTTYINSVVLTAGQQAELNEWKTANNITVAYEIFDLTTSETTPPTPF